MSSIIRCGSGTGKASAMWQLPQAVSSPMIVCGSSPRGDSRRLSHTDVKFPDYDHYRLESTLDPTKPARETADQRRLVPHAIIYGVGGMLALITGKEVAQKLVMYKWMAADMVALSSTETKTVEWRGKPVFVRHRTANEIKREKEVNVGDLRDPQTDAERVKRDDWSILIGVCTHLGCVPIAGMGDFGGYYCPCHGSHYDASGRIRKGPAPLNLHIPDYEFRDNIIVIGGGS